MPSRRFARCVLIIARSAATLPSRRRAKPATRGLIWRSRAGGCAPRIASAAQPGRTRPGPRPRNDAAGGQHAGRSAPSGEPKQDRGAGAAERQTPIHKPTVIRFKQTIHCNFLNRSSPLMSMKTYGPDRPYVHSFSSLLQRVREGLLDSLLPHCVCERPVPTFFAQCSRRAAGRSGRPPALPSAGELR